MTENMEMDHTLDSLKYLDLTAPPTHKIGLPKTRRLRLAMVEALKRPELRKTRIEWMKTFDVSSSTIDSLIKANERRLAKACVRHYVKTRSMILPVDRVCKKKGKGYCSPVVRIPSGILRMAGIESGDVLCSVDQNGRIILEKPCGKNTGRIVEGGGHVDSEIVG